MFFQCAAAYNIPIAAYKKAETTRPFQGVFSFQIEKKQERRQPLFCKNDCLPDVLFYNIVLFSRFWLFLLYLWLRILACNCGDNRLIEGFFINFMRIEIDPLLFFQLKIVRRNFRKARQRSLKRRFYRITPAPGIRRNNTRPLNRLQKG